MQKLNRNRLAKAFAKIEKVNPEGDLDLTNELFQQSYHELLEEAFRDFNRRETKKFYETIKTATKTKKKNSILDTKSGPLMGHHHPGLKGRTLYEENEIVLEISSWIF